MTGTVIVDTGPLVAFFDRDEKHHQWIREQAKRLEPGLVTCEAVMAEAAYLLRRARVEPEALLSLIKRGLITLPFRLEEEVQAVTKLLRRYRNVPMSLADACLVRLSELYGDCAVLTLDSDFRIYRRHGRQVIPVLAPPNV
jgi:predicted nucleic acid-binding protein